MLTSSVYSVRDRDAGHLLRTRLKKCMSVDL